LATATILLGALPALLMVVPRWTAGKAEARREAAFDLASQRIPDHLVPCPPSGPERYKLLEQHLVDNSSDLWIPVCRIAPLPAHRIIVVTTTRAELSDCNTGIAWKPAQVICALEEPLRFLADSRARRTWARREATDVIWTTSRAMAWQDHLVWEHRQWMFEALIVPTGIFALLLGVRRTRRAFIWRAACHAPGEPVVPRNAELLLHWLLGQRCRSLPGDLSQEYALKLENGFPRREANLWYRWQIFHSIAPVIARRVEWALKGKVRRDWFVRRG
jgi:hypothetical protein